MADHGTQRAARAGLSAGWRGAVGALVLALATFAARPALAQAPCTAGSFSNSRAEPPLLDSFTPLFRQNGVAFHARVETDSASAGGRLVIRNGNSYDVELTYDVVVTGSAGPVSSEGRCVRIRAGEYAVDADAGTVFRYEGGTPTAVRVRNLRMARIVAEGAPLAAEAPAAAPATPPLAQYRCGNGGAPGQRACSTAFMAAAARAAAETGSFSGTTRECLAEYAGQQEAAARLIRASDPRGDSLRLATPACYSRGEARWGYESLAILCPAGQWTAANAGKVDCSARVAAADSLRRDSAAVGAAESARQSFATGVVLLNEGRAAEAEAEFRDALALTPADAVLHASLGSALARQNRLAEAEGAYRAAVWLDPTNVTFASLLRGVRAAPARTVHPAAHVRTASSALAVAAPARSNVPFIIATALRLVFATALTAAGALLLFPVLSALYLAVVWGGSRLLGVRA